MVQGSTLQLSDAVWRVESGKRGTICLLQSGGGLAQWQWLKEWDEHPDVGSHEPGHIEVAAGSPLSFHSSSTLSPAPCQLLSALLLTPAAVPPPWLLCQWP